MMFSKVGNWNISTLFWWPFYAAIFLTLRGDSPKTATRGEQFFGNELGASWGAYPWMLILGLIVICCCKQIVMLLSPPDSLRGSEWREFRWTVGFTRALAISLIFIGALWAKQDHLYSESEPDEIPAAGSDYPTGYALSVNSGHTAINWLLPLGVLLAAYPFCSIHETSQTFEGRS